MKWLIGLVLCINAIAQTNYAGLGVSYQPGGSPAVAGTGFYAKDLTGNGNSFSFSVFDALPTNSKPFQVSTNVSTGMAQKVTTVSVNGHNVPIYVAGAAGMTFTGTNTGWNWNGGALLSIKTKYGYVYPNGRYINSSIGKSTNGIMGGVMFGWGW